MGATEAAVVEGVTGTSAQLARKARTRRAIALRKREMPLMKMRIVTPPVPASMANIRREYGDRAPVLPENMSSRFGSSCPVAKFLIPSPAEEPLPVCITA